MKRHSDHIEKKRGFTIVELIVVIAIIAVLATVLIPAFGSVMQKAKVAAKTQIASSMNTFLAAEEVLNARPQTLGEAMDILKKQGFDDGELLCEDQEILLVWNAESNRFALLDADMNTLYSHDGDPIEADSRSLWIAVSELPSEQSFSMYLTESFDHTEIEVSVSIDIGSCNTLEKLIYSGSDEPSKETVIRSGSEEIKVEINNLSATLNLNGVFGEVSIIDPSSRDEAIVNIDGEVSEIIIEGGSLNIAENSTVENLEISAESSDDFCITVAPNSSITAIKDEKELINDDNYNDGGSESGDTPPEEEPESDPSDIVPEEGKVAYIVSTDTQISSLEEALRVGGDIILLADTEEKELEISAETRIDLNGHTVYNGNSQSNVFLVDGTSLTITDSRGGGGIRNDFSGTKVLYAIKATNGAKIKLEGGIISAETRAMHLDNSTFEMTGGTIKATRAIDTKATAEIIISAGEIHGVVHLINGRLSISGGKFYGADACITMKQGDLDISGGEFCTSSTSTTDFPDPSYDTIDSCGAVLHVDILKTESGNANIKISGGKLTSANYSAICITGNSTTAKNFKTTLEVSGCEIYCPEGHSDIVYRGVAVANIKLEEGISAEKK